ncbi:MAG: hypothetical protein IPP69_08490 [Flavobacteriales bacterium]|nr:hypothetical protein [Flavobacteriales bacterium]
MSFKLKIGSFFLLCFCSIQLSAQDDTLRVLFLGNSYTAVNDLPDLVAQVAAGKGKTLIHSANTPGGYSYEQHAQNATTLDLIHQGNWDYVVMQEQSQIPVIPYFFEYVFLPGGQALADSIRAYNPCAQLVLYLTWGRQYGGMQCDQSGTYCSEDFVDFGHMQDSLTASYLSLSQIIQAKVAPCGEAWRDVMAQTNEVLHSGDASHPNYSGSYIAACTMYATFWKEGSEGTSFVGTIDPTLATQFQQIADAEVFDHTELYHLNAEIPSGSISGQTNNNIVQFVNEVSAFGPVSYEWNFGDGNTFAEFEPSHIYGMGDFAVSMTATNCAISEVFETTIHVTAIHLDENLGQDDFRICVLDANGTYAFRCKDLAIIDGIVIYAANGQCIPVNLDRISGQEMRFHLAYDLPDGVYFLAAYSNQFEVIHSTKFVHSSR